MSHLKRALHLLTEAAERTERDYGRVALRREGAVATLSIDHPSAEGALTLWMMVDLAHGVAALIDEPGVSVVVLESTSTRAFCSGGHLRDVRSSLMTPESGRAMSEAMTDVLDALKGLPAVVVGAIEGVAVGGGAELVTACDIAVGSPSTRIRFAQVRLGIATGWGGAARLTRSVGPTRAISVLCTGRDLSADEARGLGILERIDPVDARHGARALAAELAALSVGAVRACKRQVMAFDDPEAQLDAMGRVWGGPDHQAALARIRAGRGR